MPIKIVAQLSTGSGSPELEAGAEEVIIETDESGVFSHPLLGSMTLEAVQEVVDGAKVNFCFNDNLGTDAWPCGDKSGSLLFQALAQMVTVKGKIPAEFPKRAILAGVFIRRGSPPMELSILERGSSREISQVEISFSEFE